MTEQLITKGMVSAALPHMRLRPDEMECLQGAFEEAFRGGKGLSVSEVDAVLNDSLDALYASLDAEAQGDRPVVTAKNILDHAFPRPLPSSIMTLEQVKSEIRTSALPDDFKRVAEKVVEEMAQKRSGSFTRQQVFTAVVNHLNVSYNNDALADLPKELFGLELR
jgi:hypothetical protein